MLFNSYIFIFAFLPITLAGYYCLNRLKSHVFSKAWLLVMSLIFYAWFKLEYLYIILASIVVNYFVSRLLLNDDPKSFLQNRALRVGIFLVALLANLGVLAYYKYYDFFIENLNLVSGASFTLKHLILPLGISFFTFQQLSYVIDSFRRKVPRYNFVDYALFVTFFPQLIAGPIVLHNEIVPQFADPANRKFSQQNFSEGIVAFSFGLAKKVLVADTFSKVVTWGYASDIAEMNATNAIILVFAYSIQIYFDFSGYCDMATGIGRMFNIRIPMNFNSPYKALNIDDFWKRWHMTLTRFFTTYVYIPLGGNRRGALRTYVNVMIVFLVSGLWHGANWTFVLWGGLHGLGCVIYRLFRKYIDRWNVAFQWLVTFCLVGVLWVFFRADSISQALAILGRVVSLDFGPIDPEILTAFALPEFQFINSALFGGALSASFFLGACAFVLYAILNMRNTNERLDHFTPKAGTAIVCSGLFIWSTLSLSGVSEFLYWNF